MRANIWALLFNSFTIGHYRSAGRSHHLRARFRKSLLRFALGAGYLWLWSYKSDIRHRLKQSSLFVLVISTVLLAFECILEWMGAERLHRVLVAGLFGHKWLSTIETILFAAAVVFMIWHHRHESKKPAYEFSFVQRMRDLVESRFAEGEKASTTYGLRILYSAFRRAGVQHVSFYSSDSTGTTLRINHSDVYPSNVPDSFFVSVAPGTGVAGRVYNDMLPRYVPRLRFAKLSFPHAVQFQYTEEINQDGLAHLRLEYAEPELDAFTSPRQGLCPFRSFLSVPIKVADNQCVGVLNFDFKRSDPLDKADISMAVVCGLLFGDVLSRNASSFLS